MSKDAVLNDFRVLQRPSILETELELELLFNLISEYRITESQNIYIYINERVFNKVNTQF